MFYSNGLFPIQTVGKALHFSSTTVFTLFKNNVILSAAKVTPHSEVSINTDSLLSSLF